MGIDVNWDTDLLAPIREESPCGPESELLAALDAQRVFGQETGFKAPPDWPRIRSLASEGLAGSKDLRLLAYFGAAALRTDGLEPFVRTLEVASEWMDRYWPHVHPVVDEDALMRSNALSCFADRRAVLDALRRVPLVSDRQWGTFSLRDIELAAGNLTPAEGEARPDEAKIIAAFAATATEEILGHVRRTERAIDAIKRADQIMVAHTSTTTPLAPLSAEFGRMARQLRARLDGRIVDGPDTAEPASGSSGEPARAATAPRVAGPIQSREDAIRALDAVAEFFRRTEPSSPVPIFLERAKRLVAKDFFEVLADIVPEALAQARAAGGVPDGQ